MASKENDSDTQQENPNRPNDSHENNDVKTIKPGHDTESNKHSVDVVQENMDNREEETMQQDDTATSNDDSDSQMDSQSGERRDESPTVRKSRRCPKWTPGTYATMHKGSDSRKQRKSKGQIPQRTSGTKTSHPTPGRPEQTDER